MRSLWTSQETYRVQIFTVESSLYHIASIKRAAMRLTACHRMSHFHGQNLAVDRVSQYVFHRTTQPQTSLILQQSVSSSSLGLRRQLAEINTCCAGKSPNLGPSLSTTPKSKLQVNSQSEAGIRAEDKVSGIDKAENKIDPEIRGRKDAERLIQRVAAMIEDADKLLPHDREAFNLPLAIWWVNVQASRFPNS